MKAQTKHDNLLFNLATFEDTRATNVNVQKVYGVLFDFDTLKEEGLIDYDKVTKVFGEPVECLIYSTHSGEYKRRLIVLFQEPISYNEAVEVYSLLGYSFTEAFPECGLDAALLNVAQPYYFPRKSDDSIFEKHIGKKFNAKSFLVGSSRFGLTKEEVANFSNRYHLNISYSDQIHYYDQITIPLLDKLAPGDRWFKSQSILGKVFRKAPLLEERLYNDFKARGVDSETIRKLKALWKKNAYK